MAKVQRITVDTEVVDDAGNATAHSVVTFCVKLDAEYSIEQGMDLAQGMIKAQARAHTDPMALKVAELEKVVARLDAATERMHRALYGDGGKVAA